MPPQGQQIVIMGLWSLKLQTDGTYNDSNMKTCKAKDKENVRKVNQSLPKSNSAHSLKKNGKNYYHYFLNF